LYDDNDDDDDDDDDAQMQVTNGGENLSDPHEKPTQRAIEANKVGPILHVFLIFKFNVRSWFIISER